MPLMNDELQPVGLARRRDGREPPEQLSVHDADLASCEVRPEAEVRSRGAEAEVGVRVPKHVEAVGVLEDLLVAVGGAVEEEDLVARGELGGGEHRRLGDRAAHPDDRGGPPDDLVDRGLGPALEVGLPERRAGRDAR